MKTYRDEAVVLRSLRYGEADRILHLQTRHHGRVSAITKGVRRTRSRLGGRLEPLSQVQVHLHAGSGEMQTLVNADLIASFDAIRADDRRLRVALTGAEAVLRLFPEAEGNERLFDGLVRFLDVVAHDEPQDATAIAFVLKLVALAGWAPQVTSCASCGSPGPLTGYSIAAGGAVCDNCGGAALDPASLAALRELLARPLGEAAAPGEAALARIRKIASETVAEHSGTRLERSGCCRGLVDREGRPGPNEQSGAARAPGVRACSGGDVQPPSDAAKSRKRGGDRRTSQMTGDDLSPHPRRGRSQPSSLCRFATRVRPRIGGFLGSDPAHRTVTEGARIARSARFVRVRVRTMRLL